MTVTMTRFVIVVALLTLALLPLSGCASSSRDTLFRPTELRSPYPKSNGQMLWAVVPPVNESGTTLANTEAVGDSLVSAVQQTHGLRCLPLDRTIAVMNALQMTGVRTPADARELARALGVDALLVSTITAWDPYDPPKIGLSLALFARTEAMGAVDQVDNFDPRDLVAASSDQDFLRQATFSDRPVAVVSEHMDAQNHIVLSAVRSYATGRHDDQTAAGWRRYVMSMPLYTEFAAHHAVGRLLLEERTRVAPPPPPAEPGAEPGTKLADAR